VTLTVSALTPEHHGRHARITLNANDTHQGRLAHARNPSYHRRDVQHWWLIVPSVLPHTSHDALSLQWAGSATVHLLENP
jgi:hypothetical protein